MEISSLFNDVQLRRKALLTPCGSKDGLRRWFRMYLKLDFPDVVIDTDSTGSPLDIFWEIYHAGVTRDPDYPRRVLVYASRDSYKTLGAAALEILALLHMHRSLVHQAAIEQQSGKAQEYLKNFLDNDDLSEFKVGDNKRTVAVCWFEEKANGDIYTLKEWEAMGGRALRGRFIRHSYYAKIIVNTAQSANSDHTAWMTVDELDLIRFPKAYKESLFIPGTQTDVYGNKQPPITLITSTRKSSGGLVQAEIDNATKTGTRVHHWNVLDVTERCPTTKHRPDLPKLPVYRSDDTLLTITPEQYKELEAVDPKKATGYAQDEAYHGCIHNCKIFAACQGRLARQTSNAKLLKELADTTGKFAENDLDMALAQLLCRKPGRAGSVYTTLNKTRHLVTAKAMWEIMTGDPPTGPVTKEMLVAELGRREAKVWGGMDFGFTHCFASVTGWQDGRRLFILDAFEIPGLEPNECVEICNTRIKKFGATIYPDTAYPAYIKMFRKAGFKMNTHDKDVHGGIEAVRRKLNPAGNSDPELFLLADDEGCQILYKRMDEYKWLLDSQGNPTDVPDETNDDLCDAVRYMVQNAFKNIKVTVSRGTKEPETVNTGQYTEQDWMTQKIQELTSGAGGTAPVLVKKGSFVFDG